MKQRKLLPRSFLFVFATVLAGLQTYSRFPMESPLGEPSSSSSVRGRHNNTSALAPLPPTTPRQLTGSWIGNTWVPTPPWRLYSPSELREVYRGKKILFVGDSLARRAAMTLFPILNSSSPNAELDEVDNPATLNLNKIRITEPCTKYQWNGSQYLPRICRDVTLPRETEVHNSSLITNHNSRGGTESPRSIAHLQQVGGQVLQMWIPCFADLTDFVQSEVGGRTNLTDSMDILVVSAALHEYHKPFRCYKGAVGRIQYPVTDAFYKDELSPGVYERLLLLLQALEELQRSKPHLHIIWKTAGFLIVDDSNGHKVQIGKRINEIAMDFIDSIHQKPQQPNNNSPQQQQPHSSNREKEDEDATRIHRNSSNQVQYIHWGGAVEPRSFGSARIRGDTVAHYGLEARLVFLQMLTNVLVASAAPAQ